MRMISQGGIGRTESEMTAGLQESAPEAAGLPQGYSVWSDEEGDWWLMPPSDVTIFSVPGESLLLVESASYGEAVREAMAFLA